MTNGKKRKQVSENTYPTEKPPSTVNILQLGIENHRGTVNLLQLGVENLGYESYDSSSKPQALSPKPQELN